MTTPITVLLWDHLPGIVQGVTLWLVAWGWWSLKRVFVSRADFVRTSGDLGGRMDQLEARQYEQDSMQRQITDKLDQLPTTGDLHRISLSLRALEGDVKAARAQMDGLAHATRRLERSMDMITEVHMEPKP